jgi:hypothetical protein
MEKMPLDKSYDISSTDPHLGDRGDDVNHNFVSYPKTFKGP